MIIYKVIEKKIIISSDFEAMAEPKFELIILDSIRTEVPVHLNEKVDGKKIIEINHTLLGIILTVID